MHRDDKTVETIAGVIVLCSIHRISDLPTRRHEVTVLPEGKVLGVFAVLTRHAIVVHHRELRDSIAELAELSEKTSRRIIIEPVVVWAPRISPPTTVAVDRIRHIRSMHTDHTSATFGARAGEIGVFVAIGKSATEAAGRAQRWRWDLKALPSEFHSYPLQELKILERHVKRRTTE